MRRAAKTLAMIASLGSVFVTACGAEPGPHRHARPRPEAQAPHSPRPLPPSQAVNAAGDGPGQSLLEKYGTGSLAKIAPREERRNWYVTPKSQAMAVSLIRLAAHDDPELLREFMTPHAGWGIPSRSELGRRPIFDETGGLAMLDALRAATSRLPAEAQFSAPPISPTSALNHVLALGAEPYWVHCRGKIAGLDFEEEILIKLVMFNDELRIDYVGVFEEDPRVSPPIRPFEDFQPPASPVERPRGVSRISPVLSAGPVQPSRGEPRR